MKELVNFLKGAIELTNQIGELTGKVGAESYPQKSTPQKPKGYVIKTKTGSSPVQKILSAKKAELSFSFYLEPSLGEPLQISANVKFARGRNGHERKDNSSGG
ncbi:hypothetical protein [Phorcysia thermohydrogeniphila]|uniref:Uncharacterized protein n=1 Tax=Phorcysia thermohydrogeniphila TaxID=936138 RepID=A0A4V2PDU3_9BACT|nr:hypothetical protein [Phorcysia thermohydrogeniphila]TCK06356.1 hypothetical protein CLV27_0157 [Phorcysia thermohydrogeniphila]